MTKSNRRNLLKLGVLSSTWALLPAGAKTLLKTPYETAGPFYPHNFPHDKDFDLTRVEGVLGEAIGEKIFIEGQVIDQQGNPLPEAVVEIWQANAAGRYVHPSDTSDAPVDPNFQGWARTLSGNNGEFKFKTILPGAYSVSSSSYRTPHIHYKISKSDFKSLTTQMYFPDQKLNSINGLLSRKTQQQRELMIAKRLANKANIYSYRIILAKL